eukprot:TRINITY_DN10044_c0_g1_i2.p1 TRINITY_DN10044_c0_g1~~TRINITY_DN10044_c0_g1_i2.p1  ORF type:complete len:171 (-),score=49.41 TRINITY_DN10044_c0_g1_i2:309-821(-)
MAKLAIALAAAGVLAVGVHQAAFMLPTIGPGSALQREPVRGSSKLPALSAFDEADVSSCLATLAAAAVIGLAVGLAAPQAAFAQQRAHPTFSLDRPAYMQGIDAVGAATKKGEIDWITRSRIEAMQYPQYVKELRAEQELMAKNTIPKEVRNERERQKLLELAKVTELPM